jgi:hypothetical protein
MSRKTITGALCCVPGVGTILTIQGQTSFTSCDVNRIGSTTTGDVQSLVNEALAIQYQPE